MGWLHGLWARRAAYASSRIASSVCPAPPFCQLCLLCPTPHPPTGICRRKPPGGIYRAVRVSLCRRLLTCLLTVCCCCACMLCLRLATDEPWDGVTLHSCPPAVPPARATTDADQTPGWVATPYVSVEEET